MNARAIAGLRCIVSTLFGQNPSVSLKNFASSLISSIGIGWQWIHERHEHHPLFVCRRSDYCLRVPFTGGFGRPRNSATTLAAPTAPNRATTGSAPSPINNAAATMPPAPPMTWYCRRSRRYIACWSGIGNLPFVLEHLVDETASDGRQILEHITNLGEIRGDPATHRLHAGLLRHPLLQHRLTGLPQIEFGIDLPTQPLDLHERFLQQDELRLHAHVETPRHLE